MKKNQILIEQYKQLQRLKNATRNNIPELYACFAKVLIEDCGMSVEEVEEIFTLTQETWRDLVDNDKMDNMVQWCEETTGISLRMNE